MIYREFDEWYHRELDLALRTEGRGHLVRLRAKIRRTGVYRTCTGLYASLGRRSSRSRAFAGDSSEALCRTRTGDPFLTMQPRPYRLIRCIALALAVFWLLVGVGVLWLFGGLDAP